MSAINPACSRIAIAAALADQASVRGDRLAKNSPMRLPRLNDRSRTTVGLGVDLGEQFFHRTRGGRAQSLVEMDGLAEFLAHQRVAASKLGIARKRLFDALGVATAQRSRRMPRQELFDLLALGRFLFHRIHGQPRSIPCSFRSSESFLRA